MKNKILLVILIISLGINIGGIITIAYQSSKKNYDNSIKTCNNWENSPVRKILDLNAEQIELLGKYHSELQAKITPIKEKIKQNRLEIFLFIKKGETADTPTEKLLYENSSMSIEIEKNIIHHLIKIRKELSTEQRNKFDVFLEQGFWPLATNCR